MRVLVVRFSALGDVVLTLPVLRALRERFPQARIHFLTKRRYAELFSHEPDVSRLITWEEGWGLQALLRLGLSLRRFRYEILVDLQSSPRSRILSLLIGARQTVRFRKPVLARSLLVEWGILWLSKTLSVMERYLECLRPLGVSPPKAGTSLAISPQAREKARTLLGLRGWFGMAPGAGVSTKRWMPSGFSGAAKRIHQNTSWDPVFLGGMDEASLAEEIRLTVSPSALNLCGKLSLMETAAVLENLHLFVTNDTGLMHLACAVGVPVVALFGPTVEEFGFSPLGGPTARARVISKNLPCRPCHPHGPSHCYVGTHACMRDISPEEVSQAALKVARQEVAVAS